MSAVLMDGRKLAADWKNVAAMEAQQLIDSGVMPHLGVIVVGDDPASQTYIRNKENACKKAGIKSTVIRLPEDCSQADLEMSIQSLNVNTFVHGILLQLPLPKHLDEKRALNMIDPDKDVDGFHPINAGRMVIGEDGFVPCTPLGIMKMLEHYEIDPRGKHVVIIGRSNIVGKPMSMLLLAADATVTICHSKTERLREIVANADILVVAVGKPGFVTWDMVKPGAVVIDVGINRTEQGIVGDVDFESVRHVADYITPVPGGVGQMTVAMLLMNTIKAAQRTL